MKLKTTTAIALASIALSLSGTYASAADHSGGHHGKAKNKVIVKFDADGNGELSKTEFQAYTMEKFNKMDTDKSGSLSAEEYSMHHGAKRKMKKQAMEMKEEMIKNKGANY